MSYLAFTCIIDLDSRVTLTIIWFRNKLWKDYYIGISYPKINNIKIIYIEINNVGISYAEISNSRTAT